MTLNIAETSIVRSGFVRSIQQLLPQRQPQHRQQHLQIKQLLFRTKQLLHLFQMSQLQPHLLRITLMVKIIMYKALANKHYLTLVKLPIKIVL